MGKRLLNYRIFRLPFFKNLFKTDMNDKISQIGAIVQCCIYSGSW